MKKIVIVISLLFFFPSCVTLNEKLSKSDLAGKYHSVRTGDSLAFLEKKYRINKEEIKEVNGIENDRELKIGQVLFIPDADPIGKKIARVKKPLTKPIQKPKLTYEKALFDFPLPKGKIIYRFSKAKNNPYDGLGIKAKRGSKILVADQGRVLFAGNDGTKYGLLVIVEHKEPYITVYAHLDRALVKTGQIILRGEAVGTVGTSGGILFPHLHFQLRIHQRPEDPEKFLKPS